jgi:hypothetical protein
VSQNVTAHNTLYAHCYIQSLDAFDIAA